jgi:hypothetical protein
MAHVFIAYKHEDSDFASTLRQNIEDADFRTWMDDDIQAGDNWREAIDQAIHECFTLLILT